MNPDLCFNQSIRYDSLYANRSVLNRSFEPRWFQRALACDRSLLPACIRLSTFKGALEPLAVSMKIDPRIYSQILYDKRISPAAFRLWHLIQDRTGQNKCAWPGFRSMMMDLKLGSWTVQNAVKELVAAGYLKVVKGNQHRSNSYFLTRVPFKTRSVSGTARPVRPSDTPTVPRQTQNLSHEPTKRTEALKVDKETAEQMLRDYESLGMTPRIRIL